MKEIEKLIEAEADKRAGSILVELGKDLIRRGTEMQGGKAPKKIQTKPRKKNPRPSARIASLCKQWRDENQYNQVEAAKIINSAHGGDTGLTFHHISQIERRAATKEEFTKLVEDYLGEVYK